MELKFRSKRQQPTLELTIGRMCFHIYLGIEMKRGTGNPGIYWFQDQFLSKRRVTCLEKFRLNAGNNSGLGKFCRI